MTTTKSKWINPADSLNILGRTVTFNNYDQFESQSTAIDHELSKIRETQDPELLESGMPSIRIGKDRYSFNAQTSKWYCAETPSWHKRNIECYTVLDSKLSNIASAAGFVRSLNKNV